MSGFRIVKKVGTSSTIIYNTQDIQFYRRILKMSKFQLSDRLLKLPPYLFSEVDKMKREAIARGDDLVDLGIGDPIDPTYPPILEKMQLACEDKKTHRYPSYRGEMFFREAIADFYKRRFNVDLDPEKQVLTLIGAKEGVGHIPIAFVNP
ncbi:aminotransferase class I/II-fold pyridoxal phosphate-dependent enzyme, partial [bacterium]|nr:aminotransferase class I/II-fold pyridoxal phosphate-dependent enzyme [bacterium]